MLCFLVLPSHSTNSLVDSPSSFRIELNDLKKEDIEVNRDTEAENTHLPTSSRTNVITLPHIQSSPLYSRLTYSLSVSIHLTKPPTLCHVMSCHAIPSHFIPHLPSVILSPCVLFLLSLPSSLPQPRKAHGLTVEVPLSAQRSTAKTNRKVRERQIWPRKEAGGKKRCLAGR